MFLSALEPYAVGIIIAVVVVQYAFAIFCLLKLAYLDIPKKQYVLWNLLILIVFFIGGIAFLIYYYNVKDEKTIPPYSPSNDTAEPNETADITPTETKDETPSNTEEKTTENDPDNN